MKDFTIQNALNYTVLLEGYELARQYGCEAIPTNFLIDREGKIALRMDDFRPGDEKKLAALIEEAMGTSSAE